ncbi:MAG TPA: hypothetical protein VMD48_02745 [Solirubrobacteraceae bacterium]|nr:hypothetical protein [Solirubrobacteraceae bacterium]
MPRGVAAIALVVVLAGSAAAAAAALKGKTYTGKTSVSGTGDGQRVTLIARRIRLSVSRNGATVKVSLPGKYPLWYCNDDPGYTGKQRTTPARIANDGSFTATVAEGVAAYHGTLDQRVSGRFSGAKVTGRIKTAGACGGSTTFTAHS